MAAILTRSASRISHYFRRHGLWATALRAALAARRMFSSNGMVLLYCDLSEEKWPPVDFRGSVTVERTKSCAELSTDDLEAMTSFWNPKLARRNMNDRFGQGAVLWLIKSEGRLAGYGWTLEGGTMEPHYFPLGRHDMHLFDFHVFPQFRGQGVNPFLVRHILRSLAAEGARRAFIESAEWNKAQLSSLGKTPFRPFGRARKCTIFRHTLVWWHGNGRGQQLEAGRLGRLPLAVGGQCPNLYDRTVWANAPETSLLAEKDTRNVSQS